MKLKVLLKIAPHIKGKFVILHYNGKSSNHFFSRVSAYVEDIDGIWIVTGKGERVNSEWIERIEFDK